MQEGSWLCMVDVRIGRCRNPGNEHRTLYSDQTFQRLAIGSQTSGLPVCGSAVARVCLSNTNSYYLRAYEVMIRGETGDEQRRQCMYKYSRYEPFMQCH